MRASAWPCSDSRAASTGCGRSGAEVTGGGRGGGGGWRHGLRRHGSQKSSWFRSRLSRENTFQMDKLLSAPCEIWSTVETAFSRRPRVPMLLDVLAKRFRIQMPLGSGLNEVKLVSLRLLGALIHYGAFKSAGRGDGKQCFQNPAD